MAAIEVSETVPMVAAPSDVALPLSRGQRHECAPSLTGLNSVLGHVALNLGSLKDIQTPYRDNKDQNR